MINDSSNFIYVHAKLSRRGRYALKNIFSVFVAEALLYLCRRRYETIQTSPLAYGSEFQAALVESLDELVEPAESERSLGHDEREKNAE